METQPTKTFATIYETLYGHPEPEPGTAEPEPAEYLFECKRCKTPQPRSAYWPKPHLKCGHDSVCRTCQKIRRVELANKQLPPPSIRRPPTIAVTTCQKIRRVELANKQLPPPSIRRPPTIAVTPLHTRQDKLFTGQPGQALAKVHLRDRCDQPYQRGRS